MRHMTSLKNSRSKKQIGLLAKNFNQVQSVTKIGLIQKEPLNENFYKYE